MKKLNILLIIILCSCSLLPGAVKKPEVTFDRMEAGDVNLTSSSFTLYFDVYNGNPVGGKIAGYRYKLFINDTEALSGDIDHEVELAANGSALIPVPLTIIYTEVVNLISSVNIREDIPYVIDLSFDLKVGSQIFEVPVSHEGEIPVQSGLENLPNIPNNPFFYIFML